MQHLSERLEKIAGLVDCDARIADIGTDHGYLSIFLEKNKRAKKIIACDINEKPLACARKNIEKAGCCKIETRLSDGFGGIDKDEIDIAVIAGMGGEVIAGILSRAEWIKDSRYSLILQPMTSAHELRRYLYNNNFEIVTESAVFDTGKIYTVIKAVFRGSPKQYNECDLYIGKLNPENQTDAAFLRKQLKILCDCRDSLMAVREKQNEYLYYKKLAEEVKGFLGER